MILSNIPASVIIPKNNTENKNRHAVGDVPATPASINSPTSLIVKVPVNTNITAVIVDAVIKANDGIVKLLNNKNITIPIVKNPITPSIVSLILISSI
ncbi:hypothetical protein SDC9_84893 [bioreactor metagenome]|uniref:Uncharacterized protein n=1 Tax=bioreactor metagenome TaxID=1076179 RepID=A0A644ZKH7_9ZZZZ